MERKMERNIVNIDENEKKKGGAEEKKNKHGGDKLI